jgi:hypothetical protein
MGLIPMQLCQLNVSGGKPNAGNSLQFPPVSKSVGFPQAAKLVNSGSSCNYINLNYFRDYLKIHGPFIFTLPYH